jgi:hypothetical protein
MRHTIGINCNVCDISDTHFSTPIHTVNIWTFWEDHSVCICLYSWKGYGFSVDPTEPYSVFFIYKLTPTLEIWRDFTCCLKGVHVSEKKWLICNLKSHSHTYQWSWQLPLYFAVKFTTTLSSFSLVMIIK